MQDPSLFSVPVPVGLFSHFPSSPDGALGAYLVVGETLGAGERGCRAIWAPRKMVLENKPVKGRASECM